MEMRFRQIPLTRRYPLRISRGVSAGATNLFVFVEEEGVTGVGEMAPGALTGCDTAAEGERILAEFAATLGAELPAGDAVPGRCVPFPAPCDVHRLGREAGVPPCALAALDIALWDLLAKRARLPLHALLGLARRSVPTSLTLGINPPEVTRERVPEILERTGARYLKVKLGSPDGIEADCAHFTAAQEAAREWAARRGVRAPGLRVDANGGWQPDDARTMMRWLEERGVEYVEQPLSMEALDALPALCRDRPLPVYLDENCRFACDIPAWAAHVDGVNVKLMKSGGITEALRIVAVARAFGLGTMIGCMGESSVAIAAGASLGALFDHVDLDSHLNLRDDPASGAEIVDGIVLPAARPGHGAVMRDGPDANPAGSNAQA